MKSVQEKHDELNGWLSSHSETAMLVILFIALIIRIVGLGSLPFTAAESKAAVEAAGWTGAGLETSGVPPVYLGLTGILFKIFHPANWLARFWPMIFGLLLVAWPFSQRQRFGNLTALVISLMLAIDPALVHFSRTALTPMFLLASVLWGWTFWEKKQFSWLGLAFAVFWLSGAYVIGFVITGLLTLLIAGLLKKDLKLKNRLAALLFKNKELMFKQGLPVFLGAMFVFGSRFFADPAGFGNLGASLPAWVEQIKGPIFSSPQQPLFLVLVYALPVFVLMLLFGEWAADLSLWVWTLVSLVLFFMLGAQDSGWFVFLNMPIYIGMAMTAKVEGRWKNIGKVSLMTAALLLTLLAFFGLNVKHILAIGIQPNVTNLLVLAAGFFLLLVALFLISYGWGIKTSTQALRIAATLTVFIILGMLSGQTAFAPGNQARLEWVNSPIFSPDSQLTALIQTYEEKGFFSQLELQWESELQENAPAVWALKTPVNSFAGRPTQVMISANETLSNPETAFRGMRLRQAEWIEWSALPARRLFRAVLDHQLPVQNSAMTFWIRTDLFKGLNNDNQP